MTKDKSAALARDFPRLYADYSGDPTKTNMAWGFECGDGWEPLLRRLSEKLEKLDVVASQVKEKFGTLRFYILGGTDEAYEAITAAEEESASICEMCGEPGVLRSAGWWTTMCDTCYANHAKESRA